MFGARKNVRSVQRHEHDALKVRKHTHDMPFFLSYMSLAPPTRAIFR